MNEDDEVMLPVPLSDEDGSWNGVDTELIATTPAEYFDQIGLLLKESGKNFSLLEAFEVLGVCPQGFIDEFTASIIQLESDTAVYHVLPRGKGIFNEPEYLMDAFRSVRKANGDYYIWKHRKK